MALAFSTASHFEGHSLYANILGLSHANYNLQKPVYLSDSENQSRSINLFLTPTPSGSTRQCLEKMHRVTYNKIFKALQFASPFEISEFHIQSRQNQMIVINKYLRSTHITHLYCNRQKFYSRNLYICCNTYNKYINKYFHQYLCIVNEISSRFILRKLHDFSLIRNNAWSDVGMKKGRNY